ncbi:STAS domain-containing protein [Timonella sp. A28]|uniref:STAS domain-containing protein n=1 Tax=Timonella sp. A28 TaxID=3442640 RepID=UPI003EC0F9DD
MFEISTTPIVTTLTIDGDLDLSARPQFIEIVARIASLKQRLLTVDMCNVDFMDSTGAAFLISLAETGQRRGWMTVLRGCSESNQFVLDICGATLLFRFDHEHSCLKTP